MGALDDFMVKPNITLLDKTRIQDPGPGTRDAARYGPRSATKRRMPSSEMRCANGRSSYSPRSATASRAARGATWAAMQDALGDATLREVSFDMLRHDKEARNSTLQPVVLLKFFRALGEPELGALLCGQTDVDIAAAGQGEVHFDRSQTLMQGAPCCTFRYKVEPRLELC